MTKFETPHLKQITMKKTQSQKYRQAKSCRPVFYFGHLDFDIVWELAFEIWNFVMPDRRRFELSEKAKTLETLY